MERRKIYIITSLVVLALLTALALWYSYIVKQETLLGTTQNIETPINVLIPPVYTQPNRATGGGASFGTKYNESISSTTASSTLPVNNNQVQVPETWSLRQVYADPVRSVAISTTEIAYLDTKTNSIRTTTTAGFINNASTTPTLKDVYTMHLLPDSKVIVISTDSLPYITSRTGDALATSTATVPDEMLQIVHNDSAIYYTTYGEGGGIDVKSITYKNITTDPVPTTTIWHSPLTNWVLQVSMSDIYIAQKASYNIPGYSYLITNGGNQLLERDKPSLATNLSPNSKQLLYSIITKGGVTLYLKNIDTNKTSRLYMSTLAEKCVWAKDSITLYCAIPNSLPKGLPDSWYKGTVSFTDSLWRIDTTNGNAEELVPNTGLDIIDIQVQEDTIVFKNKGDQSLWAIIKD